MSSGSEVIVEKRWMPSGLSIEFLRYPINGIYHSNDMAYNLLKIYTQKKYNGILRAA